MSAVQTLHSDLAKDDPAVQREGAMRQNGINRYLNRQDRLTKAGAVAERDDYSAIIRQSLLGITERVKALIEDNETKGGRGKGKKNISLVKVKAIDATTVAYIAISSIFSSLIKNNDRNKVATKIGQLLEDEFNFSFIRSQQPALWSRLTRYAEEKGTYQHKRNFVLNVAEKEAVEVESWSTKDKTLLGTILIDLCVEAGVVSLETDTDSNANRETRIELTEAVIAWLQAHRQRADDGDLPMVSPVWAPMTEPPVDWSAPVGGGYQTLKYPLVKHGKADYRHADMSRVYAAINAMQRTPWRINRTMLALVELLWATGSEVGKLPRCLVTKAPERLPDAEWQALTPEARKGHRLMLRDLHTDNRQAASDLISIDQVLSQARELKDAPAFYIPYQLDYRGRVYAVPLLNPQGTDYVRCLFEFANGKPCGERGGMWLAIQAASTFDGEYHGRRLSKCSFQERYDWAIEHEEMIRNVVSDPITNTRWMEADKPFMFLRTCIDLVGWFDVGSNFVSALPIALDGSCSGIQHYSALLRDPVGGASVNLIASERPADVYGDVAAIVQQSVEEDEESAFRTFWLDHGIGRKVVKKPVMTYGYSSREAGFTDWYESQFVRPAFKKASRKDEPTGQVARYLAKHTLEAVEVALPAVATGMNWLIECARLLAHEGKGIRWTAPSGFPVVQRYTKIATVRVETLLQGKRLRLSIPGEDPTISKEKQKSAISPNHTHSLDAAHLVLTVLKARGVYGIDNLALIHDSFGTLPADTDNMFAAVREAFVEMYEQCDPFRHLYDQVYADLSEEGRAKLPLPPAKGDLDVRGVLTSLFAFA